MKKRARHVKHHVAKKANENYLVVVRSWMLVVVFALMLGLGAIMGHFLNIYLSGQYPAVAGVQTQR